MTLATALNLDLEQTPYQLRRQIKTAITALQKTGVLTKSSGFDGKEVVKIAQTSKSQSSKGGRKSLKKN